MTDATTRGPLHRLGQDSAGTKKEVGGPLGMKQVRFFSLFFSFAVCRALSGNQVLLSRAAPPLPLGTAGCVCVGWRPRSNLSVFLVGVAMTWRRLARN